MHLKVLNMLVQVAELGGRLIGLQQSLQLNVMREFELLGVGEDSASNPLLLERLKACCQVTDALGYQVSLASYTAGFLQCVLGMGSILC